MPACGSCGASNADEARFCASCGAALTPACASCGAELPPAAAFCPACGTPVAPSEPRITGERKLVTVLFADVTGSTSLGEQLDPERLREVLETYFSAMREEIEAEGGTVEKFIGDAVMAAFGVPAAHEDDPARALRAATRMLERLEVVNDELESRHDVRLRIRIGVNTGEVLATPDPAPGEPMVTGDIVNAAARLQSLAEPGTVVMGERTARSVPQVQLEELGEFELKGKDERVTAFKLVSLGHPEMERGVPGLSAPMVGRDAEMEVLRSQYRRAASERRPGLVTIYGDAGVGKSRLTREFLSWAERADPPATVLRGRCLPYSDGIAFWPLGEILKGHAGILDSDDTSLATEKVRKLGRALLTPDVAADPDLATAALAYSVGLPVPDSPFDAMDPQDIGEHVAAAWRSFFSAVAATSPAVVVIEDIHWADPALLDLLEAMADRVEGPSLFVCPSRPDLIARRPTWGGGRRSMSTIALDPLSETQAEHLIQLLLTVDDLPPGVHASMVERSEGNPFFLEEIIRRLIDDGSIVREGDRWRATAAAASVQIPDTVQAVLASRIDLLDPADKRILQAAAVVGRVFWPGPVSALSSAPANAVGPALERLEDRELVISRAGSSLAGEREYLFKHILTRDVAYESLPKRERAAAHRAAGTWIEATAGDRAIEFVELLAYHATTAVELARDIGDTPDEELRRSALRWSLLASHASRRRIAFATAQRLAEAALELAEGPAERSDALEALADVSFERAEGDLAWRYFGEATTMAELLEPPDGRRVAYLAGRGCEIPQRWPGSLRGGPIPETDVRELLDRGFAALPPGDSEERIRLLSLEAGWPFSYSRDDMSVDELERYDAAGSDAAAGAIRLGLPNLASGAYDSAIGGWLANGLYGHAERAFQARAAIMPQVTDIAEIGDFYAMGAWVRTATGRYEEAIAFANEGVERVVGRGPNVETHARSWAIIALERLGRWDDAMTEFELMRELLADRGSTPPYFCAGAFAQAGAIHAHRGERVESDVLAGLLRRLAPDQGVRGNGDVIKMYLARGEVDLARAMPLPDTWRAMGGDVMEARAQAMAAAGAWDEVPAQLELMREVAASSPWPALEAEMLRLEGRAALAAANLEHGLTLMAAASQAWDALGCVWDRAVTDLEIAEASGDTERAGVAAEVFERLRTPAYIARARAAGA